MYLTNKQQNDYKTNGGGVCPHCKSQDLTSECTDVNDVTVDVRVICNDCGSGWYDEYTFTGIADFRIGSKKLTKEQQAFIKSYNDSDGSVDDETLVTFFMHEKDTSYHVESRDHITNSWWLWQKAVAYGRENDEELYLDIVKGDTVYFTDPDLTRNASGYYKVFEILTDGDRVTSENDRVIIIIDVCNLITVEAKNLKK